MWPVKISCNQLILICEHKSMIRIQLYLICDRGHWFVTCNKSTKTCDMLLAHMSQLIKSISQNIYFYWSQTNPIYWSQTVFIQSQPNPNPAPQQPPTLPPSPLTKSLKPNPIHISLNITVKIIFTKSLSITIKIKSLDRSHIT